MVAEVEGATDAKRRRRIRSGRLRPLIQRGAGRDFTLTALSAVARKLQSSVQLEYRVVGDLIVSRQVRSIAEPHDRTGILLPFVNNAK